MAAGARIGRNDPCPCGSGRKCWRRCLARDEAPELLRLRMRRAEGRLVPEVFAYAHERYGYDLVTAAWWEFTCFEEVEAEEQPLDREEFTSAFLPWLVFNWTADPHAPETRPDWPRTPLARVYGEKHGAGLTGITPTRSPARMPPAVHVNHRERLPCAVKRRSHPGSSPASPREVRNRHGGCLVLRDAAP